MNQAKAEFEKFEREQMEDRPFKISTIINDTASTSTLIDSGCLSYGMINSRLADRLHLPRIPCGPIGLQAVNQVAPNAITEAVCVKLDVGGRVT